MTAPLTIEDTEQALTDARRRELEDAMKAQGVTWSQVAKVLQKHAHDNLHEWAGVPIPIEGLHLAIEERYPFKHLEEFYKDDDNEKLERSRGNVDRFEFTGDPEDRIEPLATIHFRSSNIEAVTCRRVSDGKIISMRRKAHPADFRLKATLNTLTASWAWDVDAEYKAQEQLCELIGEDKFRYYLFTGHFLESSTRSGVTYIFRRLRPTLALGNATRARAATATLCDDSGRARVVIAALCLHPIAYYRESYAGAMTPTDDVIAHLMLMRGDEKMFWRRANQHTFYSAEAGA